MTESPPRPSLLRTLALTFFCVSTALLVPIEAFRTGLPVWLAGLAIVLKVADPAFRRRMGLLYGLTALMALAPINTNRETWHFLALGIPFAIAIFVPTLLLKRTDPGVIDWRLVPRRFSWVDVFYTAISLPLAWNVINWYFYHANPELPTHWPMPETYSHEAFWRLFIGINGVGIWDELFFINTVFGILRSLFPFWFANLGQAVVYAAVLNDMAFTGVGPYVVYAFALTQGLMYEKSRCLLYVLIVHVVVDAVLIAAIMQYHYPGVKLGFF
jgi:membrane protease YdiL (CAAX protease family)